MAKADTVTSSCSRKGLETLLSPTSLKRLEKTLKKLLQVFLATHPEYQVENVEIKGTPHIITWVKGEKRKIETMKSGALAKLPRDILTRFDEFKNTTVLASTRSTIWKPRLISS